jgi:hypothetical protein
MGRQRQTEVSATCLSSLRGEACRAHACAVPYDGRMARCGCASTVRTASEALLLQRFALGLIRGLAPVDALRVRVGGRGVVDFGTEASRVGFGHGWRRLGWRVESKERRGVMVSREPNGCEMELREGKWNTSSVLMSREGPTGSAFGQRT